MTDTQWHCAAAFLCLVVLVIGVGESTLATASSKEASQVH